MAKEYLDKAGLKSVATQVKNYVQTEATNISAAGDDAAIETVLGTFATTVQSGVVSTESQNFGGVKTFADGITVPSAKDVKVGNAKLTYSTSGSDKILTVSFV